MQCLKIMKILALRKCPITGTSKKQSHLLIRMLFHVKIDKGKRDFDFMLCALYLDEILTVQ